MIDGHACDLRDWTAHGRRRHHSFHDARGDISVTAARDQHATSSNGRAEEIPMYAMLAADARCLSPIRARH